ncbi:ComF family protein [Candidatus Nomurabacteria bacterium]|nr:ComF family protein [Candidatus Nomurabacteria bacterium]
MSTSKKHLFINILKKVLWQTADIIFPQEYLVEKITEMSPEDLYNQASKSPVDNSGIKAIFKYRDILIRRAIWELNYRGNKKIARLLASILYDHILEEIGDMSEMENLTKMVVLPTPISNKRLNERGFNQCELLLDELIKLDASNNFIYSKNVLYKIKDTPSQTSIKDKNLRLKNLQGCFSIKDKKIIVGENIIIIDDVYTTGSTINEIKKELKSAGAKKVFAFTIAH